MMAFAALFAQAPRVNYASNLGVPAARGAALDSGGNLYVVASSTLVKVAPDGSILSTSIPMPDKLLLSVTVDAQDRVIVGGSGFVARPPDFVTPVSGQVVQVAVDPNGSIWAVTGGLLQSSAIPSLDVPGANALVHLSPDGVVLSSKKIGGASVDNPADLVIDAAGSLYVALVTNSAELPADGFEPSLNGLPGSISYDGGGYFYATFGVNSAINQWLLTDANTVYIATQGQGVNRSTDRGQTFATRSVGLPDLTVNMLAVDPTNSQTLYAATRQGLAKSTNGGATWSALPLPSGSAAALAVAVHPKNRAHLYASTISSATGCAFYRSVDSGATWQAQQTSFGVPICITGFLTDPNDVAGVYAYTLGNVFALPSTGATWPRISTVGGTVVADPLTFATWYAVGPDGIYKSTNKGANWILSTTGVFTTLAVGRPYVVAGTATGSVLISRDAGATWNATATPPFAQPVRSLLSDSGTIFVGASYKPGIWLGKYSPLDGQLLTSTFLGGSGSATAARLAVDALGGVTVAMETDSTDAPTTLDAAQRRSGGGSDVVITRLTPSFGLQYASYFGGSGDERIGGIELDSQGFLYMAGSTTSADLPLSANALQTAPRGGLDAFATVLNPSANGVVYSSYYGGADDDSGVALLADAKGNAVLVGHAASDSFVVGLSGLIGYQPIGAIRNAASLVAGPVAPGSLVTIDGGYGPISGISVMFNGLAATVVQSRDRSIDVALPDGLQPGTATVSIQSRNGLVQGTAPIAPVAPGLFSANRDGKGVALATLVRVYADGTQQNEAVFQCSDTCVGLPIDFGDDTDTLFLQLTATGLRGETDLSKFQVMVGGQPAVVVSVGPQGISPGLDQITVQLPRPAEGFVGPGVWNIQVTVGGQASNGVNILVG